MNAQDQSAIEGLFQRLQQAETQSGQRDPEAEKLIHDMIARQPAAPYLMAQAVLVQEHALKNLQGRVEELEKQLAERPQQSSGGFLGGLFGGGAQQQQQAPARQPRQSSGGGWGAGRGAQPQGQGAAPFQQGQAGGGGGFLAGAAQTAMGVAGGVLLGNAIAGMFADDAEAADIPAEPEMPMEPEMMQDPMEAMPEDEGAFFDDFGGEEEF
ncbi:DUF2076 domain-containing protein [Marichromatium bheemlicum]|uniref:DUF2076 domain-containing protein n=1 Tax=Marichromatium bheemlicum TaxID=365339 RepID=A0ABX1I744_9GAMM|nr:DUF2076 domain-containing protein [Marichromatium bheemlicum]NKN32052.1 DUF2076 domain-containing protein [Marichromatium bheemlicum]